MHIAGTVVVVRAERGWDAPIGSPAGINFDLAAACFFAENGGTVVHRSDREEPTSMATPASGQGTTTERSMA